MARILQVCNHDFYLTKFLTPLVRKLVEHGHEIECACEGGEVHPDILDLGVVVHSFEFPKRSSPLAFFEKIQQMRRLIRRGRYHCVDSHNRSGSIIARVAAWLERVPLNVYTAHGFYFHDDQPLLIREATVLLEVLLARMTDYTLSQSSEDVEFAVRRGILKRDRIEHIGNGINTKRFSPTKCRGQLEQELGFSPGRFRICSTGRLVKGKGFTDLLEAFSDFHMSVRNSELLIIGGNIDQDIWPYQREFLESVNALGLVRDVVVTGITDRVEDYLAISDLFVLPSYREGMPRALLEAMSMGLPSIATNIRGCREIIIDGQNGYLFEPKDIGKLASLMRMLYQSTDIRERVGASGRETSVTKYDEFRYVEIQVSAINRLLAAKAIA